jgi:hypothetical protein
VDETTPRHDGRSTNESLLTSRHPSLKHCVCAHPGRPESNGTKYARSSVLSRRGVPQCPSRCVVACTFNFFGYFHAVPQFFTRPSLAATWRSGVNRISSNNVKKCRCDEQRAPRSSGRDVRTRCELWTVSSIATECELRPLDRQNIPHQTMHTSVFRPVKHSVFGQPMWLICGGTARRALGWHTGRRGSPSAAAKICCACTQQPQAIPPLKLKFATSKTFQFLNDCAMCKSHLF